MASNTRISNNGRWKLKISTIGTTIPFPISYYEWGFQASLKRKRSVTVVLLNPSTWSGYRWVSEGTPAITELHFFDKQKVEVFPSSIFPNPTINTDRPGFAKSVIIFVFGSSGPGGDPMIIDRADPRNIGNVSVEYQFDGQNYTLKHS